MPFGASLALLAALVVGPALADELSLGGVTYGRVEQFVGIDGQRGEITFVYQGRQMTRPLAGLESIAIDRYPDLARAFQAMAAGRDAEAARLLGVVQRQAREDWLVRLLDGLLVGPCDRGGQFVPAVDAYIRWVNSGWTAPKVSAPTSLPDAGSAELGEAVRRIEQAADLASDPAVKFRLRTLLLSAYQRAGDARVAELAAELLRTAPQSQPDAPDGTGLAVRDQALLAPVRQAVATADFEPALSRARSASDKVSRDALGELLTLVGRSLLARGDPRRAALNYMRVVVHFPQDRQAAEAMWQAGQIHEQLACPEVAARLYETLVQRYPTSPRAASARAALGKIKSAPAREPPPAVALQGGPVVRRPDLLDDARFLKGLTDYGMTELLRVYAEDNPVSPASSVEALVRQLEARRAIAADVRLAGADRAQAARQSVAILSQLTRQFPADRRLPDWQCAKVATLLDGVEPTRTRIVFEIAAAAELDAMSADLDDACSVIDSALPALDRQIVQIERAAVFSNSEYDRIDGYRSRLKLARALADLGRAQVVWARLAGRPADGRQSRVLEAGWLACQRQFAEAVKPKALAAEKDPARRATALLCVASGLLCGGQAERAADAADRLTRDPGIAPLRRLEGYAIWSQGLRSAGRFAGRFEVAPDDVRDWPALCQALARQDGRSTRCPPRRVWELLDAEAREAIKAAANAPAGPTQLARSRTVAALNALLARAEFYDAADFADVELSPEGARLRDLGPANLTRPVLLRLNRELLEAALGAAMARGQGGALTVLDEAEAFLESQPALRSDAAGLLLVRLGRANAMVAGAIATAAPLLAESAEAQSAGDAPAAAASRARAGEVYRSARAAAEQAIRDAERTNPAVRPHLAAVIARIIRDEGLDAAVEASRPAATTAPADDVPRTQPAEQPTPAAHSQPATCPESQPAATQPAGPGMVFHFFPIGRQAKGKQPDERGWLTEAALAMLILALLVIIWRVRVRRLGGRR